MLETRKVFIDTQYFVRSGLHFEGAAFKSFKKYCQENELIHISTSVVIHEVDSKINASVKDGLAAIQTFRRKARLLSSIGDEQIQGLFVEIPEEEIYRKSSDVFRDFLEGCSTTIIEADHINGEELLSLYFGNKPPFGEGKKKTEFPDAISLLSLKTHLINDEKIYVISDDNDLKSFCTIDPHFISIDTLDKLLDIYTTHTSFLHEQVKQYFVVHEETIKQKITKYLEKCDVWNASTWEDAEVDDGLTVTHLGEIEPSILFINDEGSQITFDIEIEFEVSVTGPDFNNGVYDREDGIMYTFDLTTRVSTFTETYTVEMLLNYEFVNGELVNVADSGLYIGEVSKGIEVSVEENEPDWY